MKNSDTHGMDRKTPFTVLPYAHNGITTEETYIGAAESIDLSPNREPKHIYLEGAPMSINRLINGE